MHDSYLQTFADKILTYTSIPNTENDQSEPKITSDSEPNTAHKIKETVEEAVTHLKSVFSKIYTVSFGIVKLDSFLSDVNEFTLKTGEIFKRFSDQKDLKNEIQQALRKDFLRFPKATRDDILSEQSIEKMNQALGTDFFRFTLINSDTDLSETLYLNLNSFKGTAFYTFLQELKAKSSKEAPRLPTSFILGLKLLEDEKNDNLFFKMDMSRKEFDALVDAAAIIHDFSACNLGNPETSLLIAVGSLAVQVINAPQSFPNITKQKEIGLEADTFLSECDAESKEYANKILAPSIYLDPKLQRKLRKEIKHKNECLKKIYMTYYWVTQEFIERCQRLIVDPTKITLTHKLLELTLASQGEVRALAPLRLLLKLTAPAELKTISLDQAIEEFLVNSDSISLSLLQSLKKGSIPTVKTPDKLKLTGRFFKKVVGLGYPLALEIQEPNQDKESSISWHSAYRSLARKKYFEAVTSLTFRTGLNSSINAFLTLLPRLKKLTITGSEREKEKGTYPLHLKYFGIDNLTLKEISLIGISENSFKEIFKSFPKVHSARVYVDQTTTEDSPHSEKNSYLKGAAGLFPNVQDLHLGCSNVSKGLRSAISMNDLGLNRLKKLETLELCFYDSETYPQNAEILFPEIDWRRFKPELNTKLHTINLSCRPEYPTRMNVATFSEANIESIKFFLVNHSHLTIKLDRLQPDNLRSIEKWLHNSEIEVQKVVIAGQNQLVLTRGPKDLTSTESTQSESTLG